MLTLSRQKTTTDGLNLQVFEGDGVRLTVSSRTPSDIVGFILSYDFTGKEHHSFEWSATHGFDHHKVHKRSRDILEISPAERLFSADRFSFSVSPESSVLLEAVVSKIAEYERPGA